MERGSETELNGGVGVGANAGPSATWHKTKPVRLEKAVERGGV